MVMNSIADLHILSYINLLLKYHDETDAACFLSRDFLFISCMFIYLYIYYYQKSMIPLNRASLFFFSTTDLVHTTTTTSGAVEGVEEVRYVDIIQFLFSSELI